MSNALVNGMGLLKQRVLSLGIAAGAGRGILAALALLLVFAWIDLVVDLAPVIRLAACGFAVLGLLILLIHSGINAIRLTSPSAIARRLDEVAATGGQILSGVDLSLQPQVAAAPVSAGLSLIAIERATTLATQVPPAVAAPTRVATKPFKLLGGLLLIVAMIGIGAPRLFATQFMRFADPYGDHPPYSRLSFAVAPGATKVIYGKSLDVQVQTAGGEPQRVELVYRNASRAEEVLPMFPQADGKWQATLASVTSPGEYFVRAGRARSHRFDVELITVPKIEHVRFRITPPAYTNSAAYEGPVPQAGLAGLPGTTVEVWATSNRPLSGGGVQIAREKTDSDKLAGSSVALSPVAQSEDPREVHGQFSIAADGRMSLNVKDVAGQESTEPFVASITLLTDQKPSVRVMEPKPESLATPDATIDVAVQAEDDFGVSRVQVFRSLNESPAGPDDLKIPAPPPTRVPVASPLKLSDLNVKPGDVVKVYARAEDNDPAGAKGAESGIVTLRIISQEEMNKLMLARDAMETLQSKYEQAAEQIAALDEQMRKLQEELAKLDPDDPLAEAQRKKLGELSEQASEAADAMREMEKLDLPIDLDQALQPQLKDLERKFEELADAADKASKRPGLSVAGANDEVAKMRKKLAGDREQLEQEATEPLEHLAKVFPLLQDQADYLELYQRQRELADRMASLRATQNPSDPRVKARLRDLEDEQRQKREDLAGLLDAIEDHVRALPEDQKQFDDLRKTATEFADAVRASDAAQQMNDAETHLADQAGPAASASAQAAADTLEKFIGKCDSMGGEGQACLKFQPKLASGLGNSIQQMLDSANMGAGMGGMGSGGGYSARRTSLANVGLYGGVPRRSQTSEGRGGKADRGTFSDGRGDSDQPSDPAGMRPADKTRAAGESDAIVPSEYRRRVGEYFQRVADELGEQ